MTKLDELVATAREDVRLRKQRVEPESLRAGVDIPRASGRFRKALSGPGLALVAEFKRRSPSSGEIRPGAGVVDVVAAYERGGAAALSVLTDERSFGGSLDDLREARGASDLPILRKDFVVDSYQLLEAAASGADAVLLIVAALDEGELRVLRAEATALGLDCLVEVHDEAELERALAVDADPIGINNRDLTDLSVDVETTARLLAEAPDGKTVVAESGYERRDQLEELERAGAAAVLIGEALMRADNPEAAVRDLVLAE
jgi:indole-3-glycerol phosphate synthase